MPQYHVYILYSKSLDRYYIGQTEDLLQRLHFHNQPIESRKFTAKGIPWVLKLSIGCSSKDHSRRLEQFIKRMKSRAFIERLITDADLQQDLLNKTAPDC